ncbi:peptidase [Flavobacterium cyanobacteriorum]|uniref:Peptidase n=1 Tax=Flavobacterium cyanobacteriorum TaxID=2022802 RepID=A0A255YRP1_9FLAO|nr:murein L,D-transpeptidase catalytic domain family protein [Flavobacterium cyanobacteriorum]OYQ31851.1 peptidase [Flavobacterium cyanobacteriorum]
MNKPALLLLLVYICCAHADKQNPTTANYTGRHKEALAYCREKGFCTVYYLLADLSIHSGRDRFFVYDFQKRKITDKGLVTHGSCDVFEDNPGKYENAKFDNRDGSHCSSGGKYKIGKRDYSSWGIKIKYWLEGLEPSNSNAKQRVVVLHSWEAVANEEIYPQYSPLSWGCPAVSDEFMKMLDTKLQATDKPVLLWVIK